MRPQPAGSPIISPQPAPGRVTLRGLRFRGRSIDVESAPGHVSVTVDGQP
ncbi:hypothetical protein [Micromonospora sp. NBC_01796]|nr:hypothetical protein [Micromonospora sp. NBC_01796]WSA84224.1 hypothetical protein OIE47_28260 [Micromonospora sp. NBC_01796]